MRKSCTESSKIFINYNLFKLHAPQFAHGTQKLTLLQYGVCTQLKRPETSCKANIGKTLFRLMYMGFSKWVFKLNIQHSKDYLKTKRESSRPEMVCNRHCPQERPSLK